MDNIINFTNIRYADYAIMIDKLDATCEQYGLEMNAKKTKR